MIENILGVDINYEVQGDGFPVVLLHGWGGCINSMLPVTNSLKDKYKTIVIDFPGHGQSAYPNTPFGVQEYMEVLKALLDKLNITKAYIIGHSFGGRVSIMLAATYPTLVSKMVLVDSGGIKPKLKFRQKFKIYSYKAVKNFLKIVMFNSKAYKSIMEKYRKKAGSDDYNALPECMKATFVKVVNEDLTNYLDKIICPALIVWGKNDTDTPLYMGEIMASHIKDSGLVVLEDAAHFSYLDQSAKFNVIANKFLETEEDK